MLLGNKMVSVVWRLCISDQDIDDVDGWKKHHLSSKVE